MAPWLLALGISASLPYLVHPWYDPVNDAAVYILTARSLARGEGYSVLGTPFSLRPPGFSAIIAPLIALRGTDFATLNLLVSVFGAVAVVLLFLLVRPRLGSFLGALVGAAVWLNPGVQRLCNQSMSDIPGLALILACLLVAVWAARGGSWRRDLVLGLCIGAGAYVRTVNLLLVPAVAAARLLGRPLRDASSGPLRRKLARLAVLALAAALVQLPWSLRDRAVAPEPPVDQTLVYSYSTAMWHADMGDPSSPRLTAGEIAMRVPIHVRQIAAVLSGRLTGDRGGVAGFVVALLLVASVAVTAFRRRGAEEFLVLAMLGVLCFNFALPRLLLPIYVLSLPALIEVVRDSFDALGRRLAGRALGTAAGALLIATIAAADFEPRKEWPKIEAQHRLLVDLTRRFKARLEPDARLASHFGWHYALLLDRPVYSLRYAVLRARRAAAAEQVIDKYAINTVLLSPVWGSDQQLIPYFSEHYGDTADPIARVYRVRP